MQAHFYKGILFSFVSLFFLFISTSASADYIAGEEANKRGDRDTAFQEFYNAAQNSEPLAYGKLGSMYLYGLGTEKNYQQAYVWFHMSYLTGEREGERFRDAASSMMNRAEYLKAVELAEARRLVQKLGTAPPQNIPPTMHQDPMKEPLQY